MAGIALAAVGAGAVAVAAKAARAAEVGADAAKAAKAVQEGEEAVKVAKEGEEAAKVGQSAEKADNVAGETKEAGGGCNSFEPTTPVLLADGTSKPIKDVAVGDAVTATDPVTGITRGEPVVQLHDNLDTDLTDLTVTSTTAAGQSTTDVLHTTTFHPFWDATTQQWTFAGQLRVGDRLLTTTAGAVITVTAVHTATGHARMLNLTVDLLHTFYVLVGGYPVLVHNITGSGYCPVHGPASIPGSDAICTCERPLPGAPGMGTGMAERPNFIGDEIKETRATAEARTKVPGKVVDGIQGHGAGGIWIGGVWVAVKVIQVTNKAVELGARAARYIGKILFE